jgi:hypothetical protein
MENLIYSRENHFYDYWSISSLITLSYQHFAYMTSYLMWIGTTFKGTPNTDSMVESRAINYTAT